MNRKMPTKKKIKDYWKEKVVEIKSSVFSSVEHLSEGDYCFACGMLTNDHTERAHILSKQEGGSDEVDNIHLLCAACHKDSEILSGDKYNEWFKNRTHIDAFLSIAYKVDYSFFRNFHEEAEKANVDVKSISFLNELNRIRKVMFDIENELKRFEIRKDNIARARMASQYVKNMRSDGGIHE